MFELGIETGGTKVNVIKFPDGAAGDFETLRIPKPGNLKSIGAKGLTSLFCEIIDLAQISDPSVVRVAVAISGMDTERDRFTVEDCLVAAGFNRANLLAENDAKLMLKLLLKLMLEGVRNEGLLHVAVLVLVAGTGSNCFGHYAGRDGHAGGHGYRIGDEASGFYIGRRAINEVQLIDEQQKLGKTGLTEALKEHFRIDSIDLIDDLVYPNDGMVPKDLIASFAPIVFEYAAKGDDSARLVVAEAVEGIERMIIGVSRQLDVKKAICGLRGGIFRNQHCKALMLDPVSERLVAQDYSVSFKNLELPIDGVDPSVVAFRKVLST